MSTIIPFQTAYENQQKQWAIQEQDRQEKLLELTMSDVQDNIEELQFMSYLDQPLMGIESFEIISPESTPIISDAAYHEKIWMQ